MTDTQLLRSIARLIQPVPISGLKNIVAYPAPPDVKIPPKYPGQRERVEIKIAALQTGEPLHTCSVRQYGKVYNLRVLPGVVNTPGTCIVCNQPAIFQGAIEARMNPEVTYGNVTIDSPNADRIWASLQGSRYWFTFPVCEDHKGNFHQNIHVDAFSGNEITLKLPSIAWSKAFIGMNTVRWARFLSKRYLALLTWSKALIFFGLVGCLLAYTQQNWIWLLPAVPMLLIAISLFIFNHYEWWDVAKPIDN